MSSLVISFFLGIIFNLLVIFVRGLKFYRQRRISSYHFIILQIAFADLIFACTLAFDIEKQIHDYEWLHSLASCRLVHCLNMTSSGVPIFLMMLLAFERYQGIINTLTYHLRTRSIAIIAFILWLLAFAFSMPSVFNVRFQFENYCYEDMIPELNRAMTITYMAVFFFIPLVLTSVCHCRIYHFVRVHTKKMSVHVQRSYHHNRRQTTTSNMSENGKNISVNELTNPNQSIETCFSPKDNDNVVLMTNQNPLTDDHVVFNSNNNNNNNGSCFQKFKERGANLTRRIQRRVKLSRQNSDSKNKSRKLKVQILLAITASFFICNLPVHVHHLYDLLHVKSKLLSEILFVLTSLMNTHCFINGIIYSLVDFKFRRDCKNFFKSFYCWKRRCTRNEIPRNLSTTTTFYLEASTK